MTMMQYRIGKFRNIIAEIPAGYIQMVDSAFPNADAFKQNAQVTLIYIGGDTVHPWTMTEVNAAFGRTDKLWPCWVRDNPGAVNATTDANNCVASLHTYGVPANTNVILDLEVAVNAAYVTRFDAVLQAAGYRVCKYGSSGSIWNNPKTSGGTFVAAPGIGSPITTGDCVATQYDFAGNFDLSWVKPTINFWEKDVAITQADADLIANTVGLHQLGGGTSLTVNGVLRRADPQLALIDDVLTAVKAIQAAIPAAADPAAIASAVVSQLAAAGLSADQIANHILAGLPPTLAADVVAALAAKLSA